MLGTFNLSGSGRITIGQRQPRRADRRRQLDGRAQPDRRNLLLTTAPLIDMARSDGGGTAVWNYSGGSVSIPGVVF